MKKNGFIATSILYSFFLIFITLFVALVMNYLHNQVLISKIDDEAWDFLNGVKNTKITDLKVGDYVRFKNDKSAILANETALLNENSKWIVAQITTNGNMKHYYFISDLDAHMPAVKVKLDTDQIAKYRPTTVDLYNGLLNRGGVNSYNIQPQFKKLNIQMVKASTLANIRTSAGSNNILLNAIFGVEGGYLVYIDNASVNNGISKPYDIGQYYEMRVYNFNFADKQLEHVNYYCGVNYTGTTLTYVNNPFGYANVVPVSSTNSTAHVNYCTYANPDSYTHDPADLIVPTFENAASDKLLTTFTSLYTIRLMAETELDINATDTYVAGGKGTAADPYLITDGVKRQ